MALPDLTNFQKLEILREEIEARRKDLAEIERRIREIELAEARRAFLVSVAPFYGKAPETEGIKGLRALEAKREELAAVVRTVEKLLKDFEGAAGGGAPKPARPAAGRRKFGSFDDFRRNRSDA